MFPLGSPLLPGAILPLHVFEPRYRALARRCTANDETFGVVMIERGSEVGGGDVRSDVGCMAAIVQHREFADGRWVLLAQGRERVRVTEWLPDDPYPRAVVLDWPDDTSALSTDERRDVIARLRRIRAQATELGASGMSAAESAALDDHLAELGNVTTDATPWSFQLSSLVPAGPFDRHAMLTAPGPKERLAVISEILDGVEELLAGR